MVTVTWKMSFEEAAVIKRALESYIGVLKSELEHSDIEQPALSADLAVASDVLMKAKS
jgi:hypothetical protein